MFGPTQWNGRNPDSRREKIRLLIAAKALAATKELEDAITLEQQMEIQKKSTCFN